MACVNGGLRCQVATFHVVYNKAVLVKLLYFSVYHNNRNFTVDQLFQIVIRYGLCVQNKRVTTAAF